ncbi:MAG: hypothetical protein ACO1RX_20175 [Candidatus Sericytochromatia bacterium]
MALRISKMPKPTALSIPEPYQTKARALLKPWHPFFTFELQEEDGQIRFRVGLLNLYCRQSWLHEVFPQHGLAGVFPLSAFAHAPENTWNHFEQYVFSCLASFVSEVLAGSTRQRRCEMQLVAQGQVDWPGVVQWLSLLTDDIAPWFERQVLQQENKLHFMLSQPQAELNSQAIAGWLVKGGGPSLRPWHRVEPTDLVCLDMAAIEQECAELFHAKGNEHANTLFKKLLLERATNGLYFLKFAL